MMTLFLFSLTFGFLSYPLEASTPPQAKPVIEQELEHLNLNTARSKLKIKDALEAKQIPEVTQGANLMPLSGAVERNSGSACSSAQYGNVHVFPLSFSRIADQLVINSLRASVPLN